MLEEDLQNAVSTRDLLSSAGIPDKPQAHPCPPPPPISQVRDRYGALVEIPPHIQAVLDELDGVSWDVGRHSGSEGGFYVNISLYDVATDLMRLPGTAPALPCALVQVRYYAPVPRDSFGESFPGIRKNYALVGRNEDGSAYSHPVTCHARRVRGPLGSMCSKAQAWIFGLKSSVKDRAALLRQMWRQGDVALSPAELSAGRRSPFEGTAPKFTRTLPFRRPVQVMDTHWLDRFSEVTVDRNGEVLEVVDPVLVHRRGEHLPLRLAGRYRVHRGQRAAWHDHAVPTFD